MDQQTGKYLGSDGAATNDSRLIDKQAFTAIQAGYDNGTVDVNATSELQANSNVITVDNNQIQSDLQSVRDDSRSSGVEHSMIITLNPETAQITSHVGPAGSNSKTEIESIPDVVEGVNVNFDLKENGTNTVTGLNIIIGQAHGHPLTQTPGMVNESGTSQDDKNTASSMGIPIYSVDSFSGKKTGGVGQINRVTPNGTQDSNVGKTGGGFNIGINALHYWSGKR